MDVDSDAWYPFAIKDGTTRMLIDSKNLPSECATLGGKMVEIRSAMQAMEVSSGAINPGLSHHSAQKNAGGPCPYNVVRSAIFRPCVCSSAAQATLHKLRTSPVTAFKGLGFAADCASDLRAH